MFWVYLKNLNISKNLRTLKTNFEEADGLGIRFLRIVLQVRGTFILGEVRHVWIWGVTQQLLFSKSNDFLPVFALAQSKIRRFWFLLIFSFVWQTDKIWVLFDSQYFIVADRWDKKLRSDKEKIYVNLSKVRIIV